MCGLFCEAGKNMGERKGIRMTKDSRRESVEQEGMERDMQPEIREFVSREASNKKENKQSNRKRSSTDNRRKTNRGKGSHVRRQKRNSEEQTVVIAGFILMMILFLVIGVLACKVKLTIVCLMAVLEFVLARCLYPLPIWIHLVVLAAQIVAGVFAGQALFAILAALVYLVAVILLCYRKRS